MYIGKGINIITISILEAFIMMAMPHTAASCVLYIHPMSTSSIAHDLPMVCARCCDPPPLVIVPMITSAQTWCGTLHIHP